LNEVEDVIHLFLINNIHFSKNKIEYLFSYFSSFRTRINVILITLMMME